MYLQQFDAIVKEKCKQHKPMKIHNTSSLFSREAAIKFRNDEPKYEPQASGNLVGSQPGASYVGYQSGFKSAIGRDEIEILKKEVVTYQQQINDLLEEAHLDNLAHSNEFFRQRYEIQRLEHILQQQEQRHTDELQQRDYEQTAQLVHERMKNRREIGLLQIAKEEKQAQLAQIMRKLNESYDVLFNVQVANALSNQINKHTLVSIYRGLLNKNIGSIPIDYTLKPDSSKEDYAIAIHEFLDNNNILGNFIKKENGQVDLEALINLHELSAEYFTPHQRDYALEYLQYTGDLNEYSEPDQSDVPELESDIEGDTEDMAAPPTPVAQHTSIVHPMYNDSPLSATDEVLTVPIN